MWRRNLISVLLAGALCAGVQAGPIIHSGELSSADGGITGTPGNPWLTGGTSLAWSVTDYSDGTYLYEYRLVVPEASKNISHWILEVSPTFTAANILSVPTGTLASGQPDDYPKAGDVGMPDTMRGLKFEHGAGVTGYDWTVSLLSDRPPAWGDFYAKDGQSGGSVVAVWNAGFTFPDTDPTAAAQSGTVDYHILVPDTQADPIPAPGAGLLAGIGAGLVTGLRRRRAS